MSVELSHPTTTPFPAQEYRDLAAQTESATVSFIELCGHLDGLSLVDGGQAVGEIAEIYRVRAETILNELAAAYLPVKEPVLADELWAHLYPQTFILRDEHLYLEVEHDYPQERQSVIKCWAGAPPSMGVEADEVVTCAMIQAAVLGNAHCEEIELWASQIRGVMVECGEKSLDSFPFSLFKRLKIVIKSLTMR